MTMKLPPGTLGQPAYSIYGCFSMNLDNSGWIRSYEGYLDIRMCRLNWLLRKKMKRDLDKKMDKMIKNYEEIRARERVNRMKGMARIW